MFSAKDYDIPTKLIILAIVLLLINLLAFNHIQPLRAEEPRRALVAFEMMKDGNYINPHLHGENYYNKPPVYNWLIAVSMHVFGTGEWASRLPGVLSYLGIGLLIFFCLKNYASRNVRILAAFAFLTSTELFFYGSVNSAEIDIFYALITMLQVLSIFYFMKKEQYFKLFIFSYLLMSVGFLTKGIPSIAFQGLTLLGYFIASKQFKKLFSWQHITGALLGTSIIFLYLYLYSLNADAAGFLSQQFKESSQRTANEHSLFDILLQLVRFPLSIFEKILPWSLLAIFFLAKPVRQHLIENKLLHFLLVFILANILIYWTAPEVRARYLYMFFPFLIITLVTALDAIKWEKSMSAHYLETIFISALFISGAACLFIPFFLKTYTILVITVSILCAASLLILAWTYYKNRKRASSLWFLVIAILVVRMGYSIVILPIVSKAIVEDVYIKHTKAILEIAAGRPVYLTGRCEYSKPNISLLGKTIYKHKFKIPPTIPYQIPYNYAKWDGRIMYYKEDPKDKNAVYLGFETGIKEKENKTVLYTFEAENVKRNMILYEYTN